MKPRYFSYAYYFLAFFFLIPSFSLGPLYSQGLLKVVSVFFFAAFVWFIAVRKISVTMDRFSTAALLLYVFSLSLSGISVLDASAFFYRLKDIVTGILFFLVGSSMETWNTKRTSHLAMGIITASIVINTSSKLFIGTFPDAAITFLSFALHESYIDTIAINSDRNRVYFESYDEVFLPLLMVSSGKYGMMLAGLISIASFMSNFRTKAFMLVVSFIGSAAVFFRSLTRGKIAAGMAIVAAIFVSSIVLGRLRGFTVIDRFLLADKQEDVVTITSRRQLFQKGIDIGRESPLTGIGLNQFDYYVEPVNWPLSMGASGHTDLLADDRRPHDIVSFTFAETGVIGLIGLGFLLFTFVRQDQDVLKSKNTRAKGFVVSFWSLFVFSLFNPATNFSYIFLFWFLRAHITQCSGQYNH